MRSKTIFPHELADPPNNLIDAVYLSATFKNAEAELHKARHGVSYFQSEISSLQHEADLPPEYRDAYRQLVSMADNVTAVLRDTLERLDEFREEHRNLLHIKPGPVSNEVIEAAHEVTAGINRAEADLVAEVEQARSTLIAQESAHIIDWSMMFEYHFTLLLRPGPERAFYSRCVDGEDSLRIEVEYYLTDQSEEPYNWNFFKHFAEHPLSADHHGYLVHCIIDHSPLCWQLLPYIEEVEIKVEFTDFECAWLNPRMPANPCAGVDERSDT